MEKIVGYLAYPIFELSMYADQLGSGVGVTFAAAVITLACIFAVTDGLKITKPNIYSTALLLAPFVMWFVWLSSPVSNAGVGNFVLELCALISLAISLSVIYGVCKHINSTKAFSKFLKPHLWLGFSVIVMRLFMPFVGK